MQALIELPYWPPVSWLALVGFEDYVCLESAEHYQKGGYRNRCHIAGPNGLQRLSIPLQKGKHQHCPIREVRIAYDEPWQKIHWRSITAAYGNAPFFEHYASELALFYQTQVEFLFDFNLKLLQFLLKKLSLTPEIRFSSEFQKTVDSSNTIDYRGLVLPNTPTPSEHFFPAPYPQVFLERHGFLPDLSALDLLFCCGNQSRQQLLASRPKFQ